jgi:hypothetical protein
LPRILHELKARGYRIVHVVPATAERPATPTEPQQWQLHPPSETVAISHWPKIPAFAFAGADSLPVPSLSDSDWHDGRLTLPAEPFDRDRGLAHGIPLPRQAPWPRQSPLTPVGAANALPVPAESIFDIQEKPRAAAQGGAPSSHHADQTTPTVRETDGMAKLISADAADSHLIPGGLPVVEPGLLPVPAEAR